jgi:hypothetical protein
MHQKLMFLQREQLIETEDPPKRMFNSDDRPLGSLPQEAYDVLLAEVEPLEGIAVDDAQALLREADFSSADAEYALKRLLNRGYLYKVEDQLFVTEHSEE